MKRFRGPLELLPLFALTALGCVETSPVETTRESVVSVQTSGAVETDPLSVEHIPAVEEISVDPNIQPQRYRRGE